MPAADDKPRFGDCPIARTHRWILSVTGSCGRGFFGHTLAHALRRMFILTHAKKVDYTRDGINFRFHLLDNVSERRYFFTPQFYDVEECRFIAEHLTADGIFVDVGANVGIYSLWAAKKTGPSGTVLAIEPNEAALARLRLNLGLNPDLEKSVTVVAMGVGEKRGSFELYLDPTNLGGSSLVKKDRGQPIEIPCAPLYDIIREHNVSRRINIMKLDIEGYEETALRSFFAEAPEGIYPNAMILENSRALMNGDMTPMLQEAGYYKYLQTRMNSIFRRGNS